MQTMHLVQAELKAPESLNGATHQVPSWVSVSCIDPLTLSDDFSHFAPTFLRCTLIPGLKQLIATLARSGRLYGREGQDSKGLTEPLL